MNQIIQSLVQSPYVRTMSAIPSKSEDLVHGVDNFLPPLSRTKVVIPPRTGRNSNDVYQFDIPRRDYLDRMELVMSAKNVRTDTMNWGGVSWTNATQLNATGFTNATWNYSIVYNHFSNLINRIELYSKNRFIESLDPDAIEHELMTCGKDFASGIPVVVTNSSSLNTRMNHVHKSAGQFPCKTHNITDYSLLSELRSAVFSVPLPFCSMSLLKKNLQTSFLETLTVSVETRHCLLFQAAATSGYEMQLVCYYHQFHPNVETVIRNANYKPGIPATLPWWEYVVATNVIQQGSKLIQFNLDNDSVCSELLFMPEMYMSDSGTRAMSWRDINPYFVLTSNGEILFESDALDTLEDVSYRFDEQDCSTNPNSTHPIVLRFGMRSGETFTGGLALASLNNVVLSIYPSQQNYLTESTATTFPTNEVGVFSFKVLMKRHYMLRIDSDTGVISRAIES